MLKGLQTGKLTVGDAIAVALQEIDRNPDLKPSTKRFRRKASIALLKSWPELQRLDPRKLTSHQVKEVGPSRENCHGSSRAARRKKTDANLQGLQHEQA